MTDVNICGVHLSSEPTKILAYADDVAFIGSSKLELELALNHIKDFCKISGGAMNTSKSTGSWLGPWTFKPEYMGIKWSCSLDSYLGIRLATKSLSTGHEAIHLNKVNRKMNEWYGRHLSLFNRAFVCNCLFLEYVVRGTNHTIPTRRDS